MTSDVPLAIVHGQEYGHQPDPKVPGGATVEGGDTDVFGGHDHTDTWQQAIDNWTTTLQAANYSELTIRQRRWQLRKLCEAHTRRSPFKLSAEDLAGWLAEQAWGSETRKSAVAALRSFYECAVEQGRMKHSPAAKLHSRPVPRRFPRPATDAVWERVMAAGPNDRLRLMLILAAYCGLRVSEIAGLRWADIDGEWMIVRGKGDKERRVPLVPSVAAELADEYQRRLVRRVGSGFTVTHNAHGRVAPPALMTFVFPGRNGRDHMNSTWVSQIISEALGPGATAHQLRHRAATRALEGTGDLAAVQELLGHVNPQTTRIYSRVSDTALRKAAEAI